MDTNETITRRLDGVVIGVLMGFAGDGAPVVVFAGNPVEHAVPARATCAVASEDVGSEVALLFEGGNPAQPLIIGRVLRDPHPTPVSRPIEVRRDNERIELVAEHEVVLRCGPASITLTRAGKILIRGAYISSHSTGAHRIKGGSVNIN
jgi:hypothetical protein